MTASALRTSFGAPANGFSSACCSFPANRIRPSVDANESCRPTLAIAYGLTSSRTASAISSAFNPPDRRRSRNPPAAVRYISAARSTDGVAPATGTNSSTSGMDTTVPHRLPNSSVQNPTRKPMCSPETATRWLRPAMRNAGLVGVAQIFAAADQQSGQQSGFAFRKGTLHRISAEPRDPLRRKAQAVPFRVQDLELHRVVLLVGRIRARDIAAPRTPDTPHGQSRRACPAHKVWP